MLYTTTELESIKSEPKRPYDFDEYWADMRARVARAGVDWERKPYAPLSTSKRQVDIISFKSIDGGTVHGWFAAPADVEGMRTANGYLWLPGYSLGNPPPGPESLYEDTATFGLNLHGNLPDTPYVHPFKTGEDYILTGIDSPSTWIYRRIVANCLVALEVLSAQPEVDPDRLVVGGMSQGGALALITAAQSTQVQLCFADMPWLCDIDRALSLVDLDRYRNSRDRRVPDARMLVAFYAEEHPAEAERIYETYRYFDPLSHADRISCPVQISAGGKDPSCRPPTIYSVYNNIAAPKEMLYYPTAGHEIVPQMHLAHSKWLSSKLQ
jgi:cephalosporin-C deacetylase